MSYNPSIPAASDNLSTSQGQMQNNFGQLNTQFGIDHTAFNTGSGNGDGFHKKVTLPGNLAAPSPAAGYGAMYGKTTTSISFPYWKRDGLTLQYPMVPVQAFGVFTTNPLALKSNSFNCAVAFAATGRYNVTFTEAMPDTNYTVVLGANWGPPPIGNALGVIAYGVVTVNSFQIQILRADGDSPYYSTLLPEISFTVLRNN